MLFKTELLKCIQPTVYTTELIHFHYDQNNIKSTLNGIRDQ